MGKENRERKECVVLLRVTYAILSAVLIHLNKSGVYTLATRRSIS